MIFSLVNLVVDDEKVAKHDDEVEEVAKGDETSRDLVFTNDGHVDTNDDIALNKKVVRKAGEAQKGFNVRILFNGIANVFFFENFFEQSCSANVGVALHHY